MEAVGEKLFDHERLEVYGTAVQFVVVANRIMQSLPKGRSYIADQFRRAAASIVLNIAEGAGEIYVADNLPRLLDPVAARGRRSPLDRVPVRPGRGLDATGVSRASDRVNALVRRRL
jgi:hypothetical protein